MDADYRLDGTLYTATNRAQVGSTDAVIAALERNGINSFTQRPVADVQRMAGSSKHLEGWFPRPRPVCSRANWCVVCAG